MLCHLMAGHKKIKQMCTTIYVLFRPFTSQSIVYIILFVMNKFSVKKQDKEEFQELSKNNNFSSFVWWT